MFWQFYTHIECVLLTHTKHTFLSPPTPTTLLFFNTNRFPTIIKLCFVQRSTICVPVGVNCPVEPSEFTSGYRWIVYILFSHTLLVDIIFSVSGTVPLSCFPTSSWLMGRPYLCGSRGSRCRCSEFMMAMVMSFLEESTPSSPYLLSLHSFQFLFHSVPRSSRR